MSYKAGKTQVSQMKTSFLSGKLTIYDSIEFDKYILEQENKDNPVWFVYWSKLLFQFRDIKLDYVQNLPLQRAECLY